MLFYAVNDYTLNRKKISRYLPEPQKLSEGRGYNSDEIRLMLEGSDIRVRALILLCASTGIRIGSIADLRSKHLHKNEKYNLSRHKEECFCFTTPEACYSTYLQYRQRYDEKLTPESYLFVQQTNTSYYQQRREDNFNRKHPKRMQLKGVIKTLSRCSR
jgi:site-specific recombinase XerD